jgi:antitoxin component of RelBE/YafQ-DinJ toxin-antitoxin module
MSKKNTTSITFRCPAEVKEAVKTFATEQEINVSEAIVVLLKRSLNFKEIELSSIDLTQFKKELILELTQTIKEEIKRQKGLK